MVLNEPSSSLHNTLTVNDLLIYFFASFPFLWTVWCDTKLSSFSSLLLVYILWFAALTKILLLKKIKVSFLYFWFIFFGTIAYVSISKFSFTLFLDMSLIFCGVCYCITTYEKRFDSMFVLKWMFYCGLFVSLMLLIDNVTGIFRNQFIGLYNTKAAMVKIRSTNSGGILSQTASAGCFIYSGLAAYVTFLSVKDVKRHRLFNWFIILLYIIAAIFINKRGFIVDTVFSVFFLWLFSLNFKDMLVVNIKRQFKRILVVFSVIIFSLVLYNFIPVISDAANSLFDKFYNESGSFSGRTQLYALALYLFSRSPWTGIGWARFRPYSEGLFSLYSDATYEVHNVYLQLLCETGILGLVAFLVAVLVTLRYGVLKFRKHILEDIQVKELAFLKLGLFLQMFFLIYCIHGNPLYDYMFLITYFIGIMFTLLPIKKANGV